MSSYIIAVLLAVGIGTVAGLDQCAIDCTHGNSFTADPVNCKNYYICLGLYEHSEFSFSCDGSMFFDVSSHSCIETGFTCTPECEKCSFSCDNPVLGKRASVSDCGIFYTCDDGEWTTCSPDAPYFNGDVCQTVQNECCTCKSLCTENDVESNGLIPDYRNCTNYYLCLETGIPDETTHGHCPTGNFDPQLSNCDDSAPCIQPCS